MPAKPKILVILGPTASGKSALAVELALRHNGEIISADSRQVYRHLDIGTAKITRAEMRGVPHHCIDIADPAVRFTAMDWRRAAEAAIADIASRGRLPIVCGGTGFYISSLVDNLGFPEVEADTEEQKELESRSVEELFAELVRLAPERAKTIDMKNKRRLSRAILIARTLGNVPVIERPKESAYEARMIGVSIPDGTLRERIRARLTEHLAQGMIEETERLHTPPPAGIGLSYERLDELGLEYRYISQYLQSRIDLATMKELLVTRIWQYARRQKTWFRKDKRIEWMTPEEIRRI